MEMIPIMLHREVLTNESSGVGFSFMKYLFGTSSSLEAIVVHSDLVRLNLKQKGNHYRSRQLESAHAKDTRSFERRQIA